MRTVIGKARTEDLSAYTDEQLKGWDIHSRERGSKPIEIENFKYGKNIHGQWAFTFDTKNHKYLKIERGGIDYDDKTEFGSFVFDIETHEKIMDNDFDISVPVSWVRLDFIPETKEESNELMGIVAALDNKWNYSCAIIPFKDTYPKDV